MNGAIQRTRSKRCTGTCKGERSAFAGPAVWGRTPGGKRVLWCPCCSSALILVPADWGTGAPNVRNDLVSSKQQRFECRLCQYDTVILSEIKPV